MKPANSTYDVVVVGGGSAGVVAAVQASRAGARTLLVEKSGQLGGTATTGGVNLPGLFHAWGRQVIAGIGWEWVTTAVRLAGKELPDFSRWREVRHWRLQVPVNIPIYAAVADKMVQESGAEMLYHCMIAGVEPIEPATEGGSWRIDLCAKEGLQRIHTRVLVDCTGDANVVSIAGFPVRRNQGLQPGTLVMSAQGYEIDLLDIDRMENAFREAVRRGEMLRSDFQAAEHPVRAFLANHGQNSMHVPGVDGSTSKGKSQAETAARMALLRIVEFFRKQPGMDNFQIEWCAPECGIRETATIEGERFITHDDYVSGRVWPDSLCYSFYPIDVHTVSGEGGIDTRYLKEGTYPTIPLGAQLPRGSRGLIAGGRCASGDQEASSAYRVQASAMAMGQVAGAAAALAASSRCELREVPRDAIRNLLLCHKAIVPDC